jgi:hypothetical protein
MEGEKKKKKKKPAMEASLQLYYRLYCCVTAVKPYSCGRGGLWMNDERKIYYIVY